MARKARRKKSDLATSLRMSKGTSKERRLKVKPNLRKRLKLSPKLSLYPNLSRWMKTIRKMDKNKNKNKRRRKRRRKRKRLLQR